VSTTFQNIIQSKCTVAPSAVIVFKKTLSSVPFSSTFCLFAASLQKVKKGKNNINKIIFKINAFHFLFLINFGKISFFF
jgi:hypothetical protein